MNEYSQRNMLNIVNHRKFYKLGLSSLEGCLVHRIGWAERNGALLKLPSMGTVEMALWVKYSPSSNVTRIGAVIIHVSTR